MKLYPDAVAAFLGDPASGLNTPATKDGYRQVLRALQGDHPDKLVAEFTEKDLVAFVGRPHLSPASKAGSG